MIASTTKLSEAYRIERTYSVEYITDPKKYKLLDKADAPWELYERRSFPDAVAAMEFYVIRLLDDKTLDVKTPLEEVSVNGTPAEENEVDISDTFLFSLRKALDNDTADRMTRLDRENRQMLAELADYRAYDQWLRKVSPKTASFYEYQSSLHRLDPYCECCKKLGVSCVGNRIARSGETIPGREQGPGYAAGCLDKVL